jgi:hypothetical protein
MQRHQVQCQVQQACQWSISWLRNPYSSKEGQKFTEVYDFFYHPPVFMKGIGITKLPYWITIISGFFSCKFVKNIFVFKTLDPDRYLA